MPSAVTLTVQVVYLALALFSLDFVSAIPARYLPVLELFPFGLALSGLFLGLRFNRSQMIYGTLLLCAAYVYPYLIAPHLDPPRHHLALNLIALLLPLNVALLGLYRERGVVTPVGMARALLILLQIGLAAWLIGGRAPALAAWVTRPLLPALEIRPALFGQPALLAMLLCVVVTVTSYVLRPNPFRGALFGAMLLTLYAIALPPQPTGPVAALFTFALALPLLTLVRESYRMAFIDELTGLPGRRALNETLHQLGNRYTIAMLDVDHFKKFNDSYGHDAGDDVLRLLGSRLKGVGGGGKPFRYGGEEFSVVFPGGQAGEAQPHLEALRAEVADKRFTLRNRERRSQERSRRKGAGNTGRQVSVTISIGYAERNDKLKTPSAVIKAADKALYRAKRKGRNRVSK